MLLLWLWSLVPPCLPLSTTPQHLHEQGKNCDPFPCSIKISTISESCWLQKEGLMVSEAMVVLSRQSTICVKSKTVSWSSLTRIERWWRWWSSSGRGGWKIYTMLALVASMCGFSYHPVLYSSDVCIWSYWCVCTTVLDIALQMGLCPILHTDKVHLLVDTSTNPYLSAFVHIWQCCLYVASISTNHHIHDFAHSCGEI